MDTHLARCARAAAVGMDGCAALDERVTAHWTRGGSAVLQVAQTVDDHGGWPLEVLLPDGNVGEVYLQPGQMVLYEGAWLRHGYDQDACSACLLSLLALPTCLPTRLPVRPPERACRSLPTPLATGARCASGATNSPISSATSRRSTGGDPTRTLRVAVRGVAGPSTRVNGTYRRGAWGSPTASLQARLAHVLRLRPWPLHDHRRRRSPGPLPRQGQVPAERGGAPAATEGLAR